MPSPEHQAVVDLVQDEPPVAAKLLRNLLKVSSVPDFDDAEIQSADLSQLQPTEYRADSVVALTNARGDPVAAVPDKQSDAVFRALLDGVDSLGVPEALRYVQTVQAGLRGAAFNHLEALVSSEPKYKSTFLNRAEAKGEAKAIITVLTTRGIKVSKDARERIQSCTEHTQLTDWLQRAVTVHRADDLFA